jgi:halogenation protein CepH
MSETFDLVVIGGGPGGATVATFVAMAGHRVLLLERETLPTYKIGESLLPATVNGVCTMLGVSEELRQAQFVKKYGGTFLWGTRKTPWTFAFSMSSKIQGPTSYAYQVERSKFDAILVNNARRHGVDVRERHTVLDAIADHGRITGVTFRDASGATREVRSRFLVDASGWTTTLARHVGERIYSQFFRNVAVFGYFDNAGRLPPPCSGNIFCAAFDRGWFWYIPLSDTLTSVGAVIGQEYASALSDDGVEQTYSQLIERCQPIRELLRGATRVTSGCYGSVRVRKDYSYCHSSFWKPGLALVGDAACFIDPVFSSGVHLATYAGLLAARSVNTSLEGRMDEARAFTEFERRYRREYRYFYDFLVSFYDLDQDLDSYYWSARKVLNSGDAGNEAFIQLVAGVAGSGEALAATSDEYLRRQATLSRGLFASDDAGRGAPADDAHSRFMAGLLTEPGHLQLLAALKEERGPETPLFRDGLVPSLGGLHWTEPAA